MEARVNDHIRKVTTELSNELLRERIQKEEAVQYLRVPSSTVDNNVQPTWRVRLDLAFDAKVRMGLEINGEIALGRDHHTSGIIPLFKDIELEQLGVSRRHVVIRPSHSDLYIMDVGSTNGTQLNGHPIGVNIPYSLTNGDYLMIGKLEIVVYIIERPSAQMPASKTLPELTDLIPSLAHTITSQLNREDVLNQALEMIMNHTTSCEASVWLVDENTGELFLEAGRGLENNQKLRLPLTNSLAGQVIQTGKPLLVNRESDGKQIKVKTGYFVEAVIYVPLSLGGVTFGVLSAAHKEPGKLFSKREEKIVAVIAELTAVAVQNARVYQASDNALTRHSRMVTALNYALAHDVKHLLNSIIGYVGLLQSDESLNDESLEIAKHIEMNADNMARLMEQLTDITTFSEDSKSHYNVCNLVDVISKAIADMQAEAATKSMTIDYQVMGTPYMIQGNSLHLYRSVIHLIDNAVKFSPIGTQIFVGLAFRHNEIVFRVWDTGPGIPEEDLPHLFENFYQARRSSDGIEGMGLGLQIVRATVESHRGTISARNTEGGGVEFVITFPAFIALDNAV